jgi:septin family protein
LKNRKSPVGQYIIEGMGDTEDAYEYVQELLPLIGEVILFFNSLESDLDHIICENISDRTDHKGLLVLHTMMYATKVELYERFRSEELRLCSLDIPSFKALMSCLKECGTLRNRVVHANWQYTDNEGYTHVRFKMGKQGLEHELIQFSVESLEQIIEKIIEARNSIEAFEDELSERHHEVDLEISARNQT